MIKTIQPECKILSEALIKKIIEEAKILLERHGVFVESQTVVGLFLEKGEKVDMENQRVHISRKIVEESLRKAPKIVKMYDRSGKKEYIVGKDVVHFNPGSAAITILDYETQKQRKPITQDLVSFVRLTEALEHIHFQSTGLISSDVPDAMSDSYRLMICLQFSEKPIVTGTFRKEGFKPMYDMLVAVRGSEKGLAEKPLAIFDACPSPPLKWSDLTAQSLVDCARRGIPSEIISMGLTGATSPVTLAGTLVQHVAENLSGLVICQLAKEGAPVIFGGSPSSFDMRKGTTPMGAIETMMIDSAYAQIGKYLHLPTHAYMGLSDSKINDSQAGLESGIGAILAALSGINIVSGPGMMDFESCQSLEKLAIDNEICGIAYRLLRSISQREEPLAMDLYEAKEKDFHFLSMPHTKKWYREEHIFPEIIDRDAYDQWVSLGKKSMADRASEKVKKILKEAISNVLEKDSLKEIQKIMLSEAKNCGLDSLPEIKI